MSYVPMEFRAHGMGPKYAPNKKTIQIWLKKIKLILTKMKMN